jgi:GTPase SAR1 family protein
MSVQEYKIVLAGDFGSGRTTFASRVLQAKKDKQDKKAIKTTLFRSFLRSREV